MLNKKIQVSIIVVNYRVKKELFSCLESIFSSGTLSSYEVIVVDNDDIGTIYKDLKRNFPKAVYIKSHKNIGYGAGNNLGSLRAKGEFFFCLNPDTRVYPETIDVLVNFLKKNKNAGMVAPLFVDLENKPYPLQGSKKLSPLRAIFTFSFIYKLFPTNPVSKNYLLLDWDKTSAKEVDVVPGTGFMIKKSIFNKAGGFDEKFFLYFEEFDLCNRIKDLGYKIYIDPKAKVMHIWGVSTRKSDLDVGKIFRQSRFYYFKKHYGLILAVLTETIIRINKTNVLLILVLIVGTFLRFYDIEKLMPFIGDQGWFYLSARDMVINGQIPLVGIPSSHPWLHQGPLWTYMLAGVFWLFGFNPLNGAYLTITLGIFSILLVYIIGSEMFSRRIGIISAIFYATSPLVIIHSRTPYHTSPIPLITLLFIFSLYKWIKGNDNFFPLSIFFLAILYNLELATAILWFILLMILWYGLWKKGEWVKKLFNKKILIYSSVAFLIPMIPILIYDFNHNFPQTLKFIVWIGYRILKFFGFPSIHGEINSINFNSMLMFSFHFYKHLIFAASGIIAFVILVFSFGALFINLYYQLKKNICRPGFILLLLWILISILGYFMNKTSSEAYLPILFPALIYLIAFSFDKIMKKKKFFIPAVLLVVFFSFINSYFIISEEYVTNNRLNFTKRISVAKEIITKSKGRDYNLVGTGNGSQFESFTMNYEYLTWWLGHSPKKSPQKLKYLIQEDGKGVSLTKSE